MPPIKEPFKLFEVCNAYVNSLIINVVCTVSKLSEQDKIDIILQNFQEYIAKNVCPHMIDYLLQTVDSCYNKLNDYQKVLTLKVLMHPMMVNFSPTFKLPPKDDFYIGKLKELPRLVVLNISFVCTDEVLEVVGSNCPLLEVIYIVSKIGSVTNKTKHELNALKLMFFVSDAGLGHLEKCKFLKRVIMNKVIRSNSGGRKITHNGIRKLMKSLPAVQFISYSDMGLVLEEGINEYDKFNLIHLHDNHVKPEHIDLFSRHCPKIKCLCLTVPTISVDDDMPGICLTRLANCELQISSLVLTLFPIEHTFNHFLSVKGIHLTSLSLFHYTTITASTIYLIGEKCPFIKYLELKKVQRGNEDNDLLSCISNTTFFSHLESLKIIGSKWDPYIIYPLCICNATQLKQLVLVNKDYFKYIDDLVLTLMKSNPLSRLHSISFLDGFYVNVETLLKLVLFIENLVSITLKGDTGYEEYLVQMKCENNFNLDIKTDYTRNYGSCFC